MKVGKEISSYDRCKHARLAWSLNVISIAALWALAAFFVYTTFHATGQMHKPYWIRQVMTLGLAVSGMCIVFSILLYRIGRGVLKGETAARWAEIVTLPLTAFVWFFGLPFFGLGFILSAASLLTAILLLINRKTTVQVGAIATSSADERTQGHPLCRAKYHFVPFSRFSIFMIISPGIYPIYWSYRNWDAIRSQPYKKKISPALRAYFYSFTFFSLLKKIHYAAVCLGYKDKVRPQTVILMMVGSILVGAALLFPQLTIRGRKYTYEILAAEMLLSLVISIIMTRPMAWIRYIKLKTSQDLEEEKGITAGQIAVIVIGLLGWFFTALKYTGRV